MLRCRMRLTYISLIFFISKKPSVANLRHCCRGEAGQSERADLKSLLSALLCCCQITLKLAEATLLPTLLLVMTLCDLYVDLFWQYYSYCIDSKVSIY